MTKMKDLIFDFVRDYMNDVESFETLAKNLIFWKEKIKEKEITADEYFDLELN